VELVLGNLTRGAPGLTPEYGACLAQAATVALEERGHRSGVMMGVSEGATSRRLAVVWDAATEQMRLAWADPDVTTEHGGYGIAILLVHALTNLTVLQRSWKRTGFDYWLGQVSDSQQLFQGKTRLEVSGIRQGDDAAVRQRERQKITQVETHSTDETKRLPFIVVIVEFGAPRSRFIRK
jgi:hypothetical protein